MSERPLVLTSRDDTGEHHAASAYAEERGADVIAYWYELEEYDGSGEAILRIKGNWFATNLGHCSCYGPWEDAPEPTDLSTRQNDELVVLLQAHGIYTGV